MQRVRERAYTSQLTTGGNIWVTREVRQMGGGSTAYDWRAIGLPQQYPISQCVLSGKKERIIDEKGPYTRKTNNTVDHVKTTWSTSGPAGGSTLILDLPELREDGTAWDPYYHNSDDTYGALLSARWDYRDKYYFATQGWSPWFEGQGIISASHLCTQARYDAAMRSIVDDATKMYPADDNYGLVVGEFFECKSLVGSLKDIYGSISNVAENLALSVMKGASVSYLTWIWGLSPLAGAIESLRSSEERILARIRTLQARKVQQLDRITRSWSEVEDVEQVGLTIHTQTINTLGVRARLDYGYDEETLLRAMYLQVNGVTQVFSTAYALLGMSFAVDGLLHSWGLQSIGDGLRTISQGLNRVNERGHDIALPSMMDIIMADWTFSQKTTTKYLYENNAYARGSERLQPYKATTTVERYSRSRLENPLPNPRAYGISPALGLAGSLGVVVLNGRLPR